jgi:hypothetical protein
MTDQPDRNAEPTPTPDASAQPPLSATPKQIQALHRLTVYGRWLVIGILWLTVGAWSLWGLRYPISLVLEHFTWAAVRYGLMFQVPHAVGLFLCLGMTLGTTVWHLRNWVFGLPKRDRQRLERYALRIQKQGPSHPLWKWVGRESA